MVRAIRWLAVAGLVAAALAAWIAYTPVDDGGDDGGAQGNTMSPLLLVVFITGKVLSFAAGVLTLALAVAQRQRPWSGALLASLILNAYWFNAFYAVLRMFNPSVGVLLSWSLGHGESSSQRDICARSRRAVGLSGCRAVGLSGCRAVARAQCHMKGKRDGRDERA